MISGVHLHQLKQFPDERGKVMHVLRSSDPYFQQFGEVYLSWINPGIVKGWYSHNYMTQNYVVPVGEVRVAIYDDRSDSETVENVNEFLLTAKDHQLLIVPPRVWYGLQNFGDAPAMVINCATMPNDPKEVKKVDPSSLFIPYQWK